MIHLPPQSQGGTRRKGACQGVLLVGCLLDWLRPDRRCLTNHCFVGFELWQVDYNTALTC